MPETKEFIGIEDNECVFQGKVLADPQINEGYAFMTLRATTGSSDRMVSGLTHQWKFH